MEHPSHPLHPAPAQDRRALIVLEIALSCAIICNALFLISERIDRMNRVSGMAENELVRVQLTGIGKRRQRRRADQQRPGRAARAARRQGRDRHQPGAVRQFVLEQLGAA